MEIIDQQLILNQYQLYAYCSTNLISIKVLNVPLQLSMIHHVTCLIQYYTPPLIHRKISLHSVHNN